MNYLIVDQVLEVYRTSVKKREKFSKFINRYGLDQLKKNVGIL
jgi:dissimilatory sulfite reductase (desulfoviridin) alpha/beta subunit